MDRFLCCLGGFVPESGFSCWISYCRCPGDACRNESSWSPPPSASERLMCEPSLASITQSLIGQARAEEVVRRRASAAKDALIRAKQAASGDAAAGRKLNRSLALGDGGGGGGGKRGRACTQ